VPKADIRTAAKKPLFDHLVGAGENRIRHGQAEGLGGLEIDDELEPGDNSTGSSLGLAPLKMRST